MESLEVICRCDISYEKKTRIVDSVEEVYVRAEYSIDRPDLHGELWVWEPVIKTPEWNEGMGAWLCDCSTECIENILKYYISLRKALEVKASQKAADQYQELLIKRKASELEARKFI